MEKTMELKVWMAAAALAACTMGLNEAFSQTLLERLGRPADAKLLIVHGDDAGMCHAANRASILGMETGVVTSCSVMVPCPWFLEIAEYAREHPEADLGLHLTLTSEWKRYRWRPLAPVSQARGLIDPEGYMFHGVRGVYGSAKPEEVEAELRAQIEFALRHGMKPTHMDSHMGTLYYNMDYLKTALKLSEEYNIPFMLIRMTEAMIERWGGGEALETMNQLDRAGHILLDGLHSIRDVPVEESEAFYKDVIRNLTPGVHEIIIHPGDDSAEMRAITGSWRQRQEDTRVFADPAMRDFIAEQGVELIGWRELQGVWNRRNR